MATHTSVHKLASLESRVVLQIAVVISAKPVKRPKDSIKELEERRTDQEVEKWSGV